MRCCETKHGDPDCLEELVLVGKYYLCPASHGRLVPKHIVEGSIGQCANRKTVTPSWKRKLPIATNQGNATQDYKRFTVYRIDGKPWVCSNWDDVITDPDVQIADNEILAAIELGQTYGKQSPLTVRRFRPIELTEWQKERLGFPMEQER